MPASDLQLQIDRATPSRTDGEAVLPDPLAEPRLDFQVDRASALAYEVKAGEYIQVIDVRGRQCSDFLAFSAPKLQAGKERGLDATATRSLMGNAYPAPGLHSKFFDHDLEPLVEVVRDTVGRHDTFGLACTAKYYEDMGYFGHINCSDNFNAELEPYTIEPRKGWPAINFFFNTAFDAHNQYLVDEPWSRPGRLRAPPRDDRSRLPLERLPGRHRPGQRLESHGGARARLSRQGALQRSDRAPRHPGRRSDADEGDRLPREDLGADGPLHRVQRLLAADVVRQLSAR